MAIRAKTANPIGKLKTQGNDVATVLVGEARERLGRRGQALGEPAADLRPAVGDHEHLHAPVAAGAVALDEPAVLETVDDTGDVRVVAAQRAGQLAHGDGVLGSQHTQGHRLRRRELELGDRRREPRLAVAVHELAHEVPRLRGGRCRRSGGDRAHGAILLIRINR